MTDFVLCSGKGNIIGKLRSPHVSCCSHCYPSRLARIGFNRQAQRVHGEALPASEAVGDLRVREQVLVLDKIELGHAGATMIDAASRLRSDLFFMGVTGVHPQSGLSTGALRRPQSSAFLIGRAAETVLLASAEKLMAASQFVIATLNELALLIVPANTAQKTMRLLRKSVKVEQA